MDLSGVLLARHGETDDNAVTGKVAGGTDSILTPDKEGALYLAAQVLPLKDSSPDYPALLMGNYILGGSFSSRLIDKLRQKDADLNRLIHSVIDSIH